MSRVSTHPARSRASTQPAQSFKTLFEHALQLKRSGNFETASLSFAELISIKEKSSGPEDIEVLKLRGHYSTCRFNCGDYKEAEAHQRETWERWKRVQGHERHRVNAGHELAKTLLQQNEEHLTLTDCVESAKCMESVDLLNAKLQYFDNCDGTYERQTLPVLRNLSLALYNLGRFDEKEHFDRQALKQAISLYSNESDHCDIIDALQNLAEDAALRGGTKEAKALYEKILELVKTRQRKGLRIPMTIEFYEQCLTDVVSYAKRCAAWGRWHKLGDVLRFVVKCNAASKRCRQQRAQRRWRQAIVVTLFIVNSTAVAKYRRCQRAQRRWHEANVVILLVVRLTDAGKRLIHRKAEEKLEETLAAERESLIKSYQALRRWREAIVQVLLVVRLSGIGRAIRARRRWERTVLKVLIVVRISRGVKTCRARKHWRHAFVVVLLRVKVSAATEKLRARGRWYRALGSILQKNRMVAALNSWHCGVLVEGRTGPSIASPGARPSTKSDESNFLPAILPRPEELEFGFDDAESRLFDAEDAGRSTSTEKWMTDFNKFCRLLQSQSPQDDSEPRIKVAILDTGIDAEHEYIKERWRRLDLHDRGYRDFLSDSGDAAPQDNDGHGTHVAGILLRYAPNAELYIGRIAETNESCRSDEYMKERVAKALKYAIDVWKVDVISMSFGLKTPHPDVEAQIFNAYRKKVILCAAASNDAIRRGVTFPANDMHVFCINACDGDGRPARFTPPPRTDNVNFSILGVDVLSTWPTFADSNPNSKQKKGVILTDKKLKGVAKYMSGTSMATPIAAALIANVFAYGRVNAARISSQQPLMSWLGVRRLLKGMSKKGPYGYDTVVPWEGKNRRFSRDKITDFAVTLSVTLNEEE